MRARSPCNRARGSPVSEVGALDQFVAEGLDLALAIASSRPARVFPGAARDNLRKRPARRPATAGVNFGGLGLRVKSGDSALATVRWIDGAKGRAPPGAPARGPAEETFSLKMSRGHATELTRVPIGAMVMRISSLCCSVKLSGGTMPVPVIR